MLPTLLLFYFVNSVCADDGYTETEIMPRCSDAPGTHMTFTPVDGYTERYTVELCTEKNRSFKEWELQLWFYRTSDYCNASNPSKRLFSGESHSSNVEWISSNHNCTSNQTVCMSATFDFIFSACYSISSRFKDKSAPPIQYFYFNITNPHTLEEFLKNQAHVYPTHFKDYMSLTWYTGVPPSIYNILLCNDTGSFNERELCEALSNCSITGKTTIQCFLSPPYGCYNVYLKHTAPWIQGVLYSQETTHFSFCRNETSTVVLSGSGAGAWAWLVGGAGGALALGALAAGAACRSIAARRKQKEVLRMWQVARNATAPVENNPHFKNVLLLYARECQAATEAVLALKAALQHVIEGEVYDIFEPAVMAACAAAPYEWMRSTLRRRDCCVLLLQTPALHCLHAAPQRDHAQLSPLLRRVVPRAPRFGDALLQYALRITAEAGAGGAGGGETHAHNYHKYYIATLSELPTEVLPCVVPYRRYPLPGAAQLLLRHVAGSLPPRALLDAFALRLQEFVHYATDHPDYLMDELMLVDA